MNILSRKTISLTVIFFSVVLSACSGDSTQSSSETLDQDSSVAYVERGVEQTASTNGERFDQARMNEGQTPLELYSPYLFSPGAKLYARSGIDVDAVNSEILSDYFQSFVYDVKDLNVSPDGSKLIFAAHGPLDHPTDYTWNIYEYHFESKVVRRIIEDNSLANAGEDTNPTYTLDGDIVFSSDRSSGNPDSLVPNIVPDPEYCYKITPKEKPSLLHSMTAQGEDILQLTYGLNHDTHPTTLKDGRIAFIRTSFTYELVEDISAPASRMSKDALLATETQAPWGLDKPQAWSKTTLAEYSEATPVGRVIASNNYTLLRITPDGQELEQLYDTVNIEPSDEEFIFIDRIVQAENGRLVAILKHKFNDALGGDLLEFRSPDDSSAQDVFGNVAPEPLVEGNSGLYPKQLPKNGWYSALWPYRDGSGRLLVSWSQCLTEEGGVNSFCNNEVADNGEDSKYGIWVYDADNQSRLPVIRARNNVLYEDVVLSRPHTGLDYPYAAFNPNYVDNLDGSQIICNYPEPENTAPMANAGADQSVYSGSVVTLDGSGSSDPEGDVITYYWSLVSQPAGAPASLDDSVAVTPSFTADRVGNYVFQLVVNDAELDSAADTVTIVSSVDVVNQAPVANAGPDQQALVGSVVTLDGSGSSDPDGDALSYQWSVISPDGVTESILSSTTAPGPSFDATIVGTYTMQLVVTDGQLTSAPDTVSITVAYPNRAPTAEAGNSQQVAIGSTVVLNGSGSSDPDGDALTYQWSIVGNSSGASLTNETSVMPSIRLTEYGSFVVQLIVNDGEYSSAPDTVTLDVINGRPVANAGDDVSVQVNELVTLDGSASYDPDGSSLTYNWTISSAPTGSAATLVNANSASPMITADVEGDYILLLVVNDGLLDSVADSVTVNASYDANTAPVADAGDDQKVTIGGTYTLDGSRSSDVDGDPLTYAWTVISPTGVSLTNPTSVRPTINVSQYGTYTIELVVNDGQVDSAADSVSLAFDNVKPVANAGPDQSVAVGNTVTLDGSGSTDVNGDLLTYTWQIIDQPESSSASLVNSTSVTPQLTTDQQGAYTVQLVVNDGVIDSDPDTVVITSPNTKPVANAGADAAISLGSNAQLDGSGSYDADGDSLTYQWSLLSAPVGSMANLDSATSLTPILQSVDVYGDYVVQLIVNDGTENSLPDTAILSSQNLAPVANAGNDINIATGQVITLDGSGSYDPQGDAITYSWSLISVPAGSSAELTSLTSATPGMTPDVQGNYVAQLIVNDGQLDSAPDTVKITASDVACIVDDSDQRTFTVTIRDFTSDHPDFESYESNVGEEGIVEDDLGPDGLPVYAHGEGGSELTSGQSAFDQWYRDVDGVNRTLPLTLTMSRESGTSIWRYVNEAFFPIDDGLVLPGTTWGNSPEGVLLNHHHNYHFTMETHLVFDYEGGETFTFSGDDDLWLFIDGQLAMDLGGLHPPLSKVIDLDTLVANGTLDIQIGNRYSFDLFFAERHTTASNFSFETNINLECLPE